MLFPNLVESPQDILDRGMSLLQRSDPIPKLLPQVRLGRMPKDSPALRAIISGWLESFVSVLKEAEPVLDANNLRRLDPQPRIAVLLEAGVLSENDADLRALLSAYTSALQTAQRRADAVP